MRVTLTPVSLFATALCLTSCNKPQVQPNIIYIMADDLGYADIGPYGQTLIKTPNLDRLAMQGLRFTQCYAGCTVSAPSRASLMTGLHTGHTFIRGNMEIKPEGQCPMPEGTLTLGTLLQTQGYTTGAFGKWGLGYPGSTSEPNKAGFDEFYGYNCQRLAHTYYPNHLWHNTTRVEFPNPQDSVYAPDIIHEHALQFIREHKDAPFFAYLSYTIPHAELNLPHDDTYRYYTQAIPAEDDKPYLYNGGYGATDRPLASFAAMVSRLDRYVGDVMALLDELGLAQNTLIIFTSDNGPHREGGANPDYFKSYGPLRGVKRDLYEGGIRVPFIARWTNHIQPNGVTSQIASFWDMMPTFAQLSGYKQDVQTDGVSLVPTLTGRGKQRQQPYLYWEFHEMNGRQAVLSGNWKAIRQQVKDSTKTTFELYNLSTDIHEDHNLAEQEPAKAEEMQRLMDQAHTPSELFNFGR